MPTEIWTVRRIVEWIEDYLRRHSDENPRVSAQWLVSEALGMSRMQLFLDSERPLSEEERATLRDWTRRRASGEPLQYITGETSFRHISVKVEPGVLIPRPETEVLVSEALSLLPQAEKPQDVLDREVLRTFADMADLPVNDELNDAPKRRLLVADICTGSGCIACSLAFEHPLVHVIATDISEDAIALAAINRDRLDLEERIELMCCDLSEGIDQTLLGRFDLVISNPPYVPTALLDSIPREVSAFEPACALDGGSDGLAFFRRLLSWCVTSLAPGGAFAFELHETCLAQARDEALAAGFVQVKIVDDLAGKHRVLIGRKDDAHTA